MKFPTLTAIHAWRPAGWLHVSGPDAGPFLQGQFTNDLRGLRPGQCAYGLWLNVKGKIIADSFVFAGAVSDEFWVGSYCSPAAVLRERLASHIIADDVTINDQSDGWTALTLFGMEPADALAGVCRESPAEGVPPGFVFRGRRTHAAHTEWVFPLADEVAIRSRLADVPEIGPAEIALRRIEAEIPAVPVDLGPADLPNEGGLESEAISYMKGCYLGQEIMARLKSMGQVRRRLVRVTGPGPAPAALPAPVFVGSRQIGELRSMAIRPDGTLVGLALVSTLHLAPGARLAFAPDGNPTLAVPNHP